MTFAINYGILLREDYFESEPLKIILTLATNHVTTYEKELSERDFNVLIEEYITSRGFTKETYNLLKNEVKSVFNQDTTNEQFISDQVLKFIRRQELKFALSHGIETLRSDGSYESVLQKIDHAVSIGCGGNEGYSFNDLFRLPDEVNRMYATNQLVKSGFQTYDNCFEGGWAPGELHVIQASPKQGKSTLAVNLGVMPLALGKPVFHVSLEISAQMVMRKYAVRLTGLSYKEMMAVPQNVYETKLERFRKYSPNLFVNYWPMKTCNTTHIRSWISRIRTKTGVSPGLIIVDWDDCMMPVAGEGESLYLNSGNIYSDLKQLAGYFNCPVITFAQPVREAWSKPDRGEEILSYEISHSGQKIHFCDSVSSMNFPRGKDEGFMYVDLVRRGESGVKFAIKRDFNRALIEEGTL